MSVNEDLDYKLKIKILEAYIFASPEPVHINNLKQFEDNTKLLEKLLVELQERFKDFGFNLINIGNTYALEHLKKYQISLI